MSLMGSDVLKRGRFCTPQKHHFGPVIFSAWKILCPCWETRPRFVLYLTKLLRKWLGEQRVAICNKSQGYDRINLKNMLGFDLQTVQAPSAWFVMPMMLRASLRMFIQDKQGLTAQMSINLLPGTYASAVICTSCLSVSGVQNASIIVSFNRLMSPDWPCPRPKHSHWGRKVSTQIHVCFPSEVSIMPY